MARFKSNTRGLEHQQAMGGKHTAVSPKDHQRGSHLHHCRQAQGTLAENLSIIQTAIIQMDADTAPPKADLKSFLPELQNKATQWLLRRANNPEIL